MHLELGEPVYRFLATRNDSLKIDNHQPIEKEFQFSDIPEV